MRLRVATIAASALGIVFSMAGGVPTAQAQVSGNNAQATGPSILRTAIRRSAGVVAERQDEVFEQAPREPESTRGFLDGKPIAAWANAAYTSFGDKTTVAGFDGNVGTGAIGFDVQVSDDLLVGVAAPFEVAVLDTSFNDGETSHYAFGIAPYVALRLDDVFAVDFMAGYAHVALETERRTAGTTVTGEFSAERYYVASHLTADYQWDATGLGASIGVSWAEQLPEAFTESDGTRVAGHGVKLGTASAGLSPRHAFSLGGNDSLEAFGVARYEYQFTRTKISTQEGAPRHPNDRDSFTLGGGLTWFQGQELSAELYGAAELGRRDEYRGEATFTLRYLF